MFNFSIRPLDKKEIIKYYKSLGEPEITRELIIAIREKICPYGMFTIKKFLVDYLNEKNNSV